MKRAQLSIWMILFVMTHASVTVGCLVFCIGCFQFLDGSPDPYEAFRAPAGWAGLILAFPFVYLAFMFSGALMPISAILGLGIMLLGVLGNSTFWWFQIRLMTEDWWRGRHSLTAHLPESIEQPRDAPDA